MEMKLGHGQTEIVPVPEDWDLDNLGNFISLQRGHDLTWRERQSGGVPVMGAAGQNGFHNVAIAKGPGVLLGRSGASFGQAHYCEHDFWPHNTALYVTDFKGNDPLFVFYFLSALDFTRHNSGGAQQSLNRNFIAPIPIRVPRPPEQRSIASTLSDMDELLGACDRLIAKKRDLKQAAMQQLLTGKTRLPGFGEGKGYKQTEFGEIPEDWDYLPLGQFITEFRGGAPLKPSDFTQIGVKVLPKGGVVRGGLLSIDEKDLQFCSQNYANKYSKNQVDESYTIVVLRDLVPSGPSIGLIVSLSEPERYVLAQGVYGFKVQEGVTPEYLIQYSNSFPYRRLMNEIMVGSTQVHITNIAFQAAKIPFPNIEEQRAIATVLSDMDAEIAALEQRRDKTRALKQAMMQELLTGRIRLG